MTETMTDPVLRCVSCGRLLTRKTIATYGCCTTCGMRRVTTVRFLSDTEKTNLAEKGISQAWIDEFCEEVDDE
jgi:predicted RNA-binding Zn-ribbon protein involved in translation (DUF1610 family)